MEVLICFYPITFLQHTLFQKFLTDSNFKWRKHKTHYDWYIVTCKNSDDFIEVLDWTRNNISEEHIFGFNEETDEETGEIYQGLIEVYEPIEEDEDEISQ